MTLFIPDVNVLIHAFRTDSPEHQRYGEWLNVALQTDRIGLADTILSGFVRVVTHPRIFTDAAPPAAALAFARHLIGAPRSVWMQQGGASWDQFEMLTESDAGVRGNVVSDAHIAAVCLANGAVLATRDRGFGRFPGLKWVDPREADAGR